MKRMPSACINTVGGASWAPKLFLLIVDFFLLAFPQVGSEVMLSSEVEAFWLSDSLPITSPAPVSLPPSTQVNPVITRLKVWCFAESQGRDWQVRSTGSPWRKVLE